MKTITLKISEEAIARLNSILAIRGINAQITAVEAAIARIVTAIEEGKTEVEISLSRRNG